MSIKSAITYAVKTMYFSFFCIFCTPFIVHADTTELEVWANEAIVATYTYNFQNFIARQREIAKYFSSAGWIAYSAALNNAKLPEMVAKNSYFVNAVATLPPEIKTLNSNSWQATMPILVTYKNPQSQQKQNLAITLKFSKASSGVGVRGYQIDFLQSKVTAPACECQQPVK